MKKISLPKSTLAVLISLISFMAIAGCGWGHGDHHDDHHDDHGDVHLDAHDDHDNH